MDSNDLRRDQVAALGRGIRRSLNYFSRLRTGMERTGFLPGDPLFQLVDKAYDAVQHLSVHVHYLSCASGVGSGPRKGDRPAVGECRSQAGTKRPRSTSSGDGEGRRP